ncbi:hypothetical protein V8D89_015615 [Ganoderma adspersum]
MPDSNQASDCGGRDGTSGGRPGLTSESNEIRGSISGPAVTERRASSSPVSSSRSPPTLKRSLCAVDFCSPGTTPSSSLADGFALLANDFPAVSPLALQCLRAKPLWISMMSSYIDGLENYGRSSVLKTLYPSLLKIVVAPTTTRPKLAAYRRGCCINATSLYVYASIFSMPVWALNAAGVPAARDRLHSGSSGRLGWQGAGLHAGVIDGEDSGAGVSGRKVSADMTCSMRTGSKFGRDTRQTSHVPAGRLAGSKHKGQRGTAYSEQGSGNVAAVEAAEFTPT